MPSWEKRSLTVAALKGTSVLRTCLLTGDAGKVQDLSPHSKTLPCSLRIGKEWKLAG